MIKLYEANEKEFKSNGTVLSDCLSAFSTEESNAGFIVELTFPLNNKKIEEGKIIVCPTHRGEQKFRIAKIKKIHNNGKKVYSVYARHISYDLLDNYILNIRPTNQDASNFGRTILSGTEYTHPFVFNAEDIQGTATANYVRRNPIDCLFGNTSNSMVNLFGGDIERDNFNIKLKGGNRDRGFKVALGKNIVGIEEEIDISSIKTKLHVTTVIDGTKVTELPEKYIESDLINNYPNPKITEERIELSEEEKKLSIEQIYEIMRNRAKKRFTDDKIDIPLINFKVDIVQVENSEQYKNIAVLTNLNLNDTCTIDCTSLNVNLKAKLIKIKFNALRNRVEELDLGDFRQTLVNQKVEVKNTIDKAIRQAVDGEITSKLKEGLDKIIGNSGGYQKTLFNAEGLPQGTIWMDTPDVNTAKNYILINNQGIAFGNSGLSNPPTIAIGIDGTIAGDSAFFRQIYTNLIKSELGRELYLESNAAITARVTKEQILTDTDIQNALKGSQGPPGPSTYTWIKFADTPTSGMSDSPEGKKYLGIAENKATEVKSTNYADYKWSLIQGEKGEAGNDGVTKFIWDKYADDDKGNNMSDDPKGKRYMGLAFNKDSATESTNPLDYKWSPLFDAAAVTKEEYQKTLDDQAAQNLGFNQTLGQLAARTQQVESKTTADAIVDTVTQSSKYKNDINGVINATVELETRVNTKIDAWQVEGNQKITDVQGKVSEISNYMRYDTINGVLNIGKSNSEFSTRYTNDRLEFLQSGTPMAYFSNRDFLVENIVALQTLTVGNHKDFKYDDELTITVWTGGVY